MSPSICLAKFGDGQLMNRLYNQENPEFPMFDYQKLLYDALLSDK